MVTISKGNSKIGNTANISLTPVRACANCSACAKDCYALKAYKQYPNVRKAWDENFAMARKARGLFFAHIRVYLTRHQPGFFRWHVAGDILDQGYLSELYNIAFEYPGTRFLVFTKRHDLTFFAPPKNLAIVFSMFPSMPLPADTRFPRAWYQDGTETRIPAGTLKCSGKCAECRKCWTLQGDVYFIAH